MLFACMLRVECSRLTAYELIIQALDEVVRLRLRTACAGIILESIAVVYYCTVLIVRFSLFVVCFVPATNLY